MITIKDDSIESKKEVASQCSCRGKNSWIGKICYNTRKVVKCRGCVEAEKKNKHKEDEDTALKLMKKELRKAAAKKKVYQYTNNMITIIIYFSKATDNNHSSSTSSDLKSASQYENPALKSTIKQLFEDGLSNNV